jgi:hypothetical protein
MPLESSLPDVQASAVVQMVRVTSPPLSMLA